MAAPAEKYVTGKKGNGMAIDRVRVREAREAEADGSTIRVCGWVRTKRDAKQVGFLEINDGSCLSNLQAIVDKEAGDGDVLAVFERTQTGASVEVVGALHPSPGAGQAVELRIATLELIGEAPGDSYPLQKKRHSFEYLREIAHLRPRTNTFGAVSRVRNVASFAIHRFFQDHGFLYVHTPIITASDAEGAGAMFRVTTLPVAGDPPAGERPDPSAAAPQGQEPGADAPGPESDFFGRPSYLTVSGQLGAEVYAEALDRVYTFGPTFRAEHSNTARHLAEFWMIEPEMAFCDLSCNVDWAIEFLRYVIREVMNTCEEDMAFFDKRIQPGLLESLAHVVESEFARISYSEAVDRLKASGRTFEFPVEWGADLQSEHEKYLTEEVFQGPVVVTDYPKSIKAFYMRLNDDTNTVGAMDVLVPRLGEIIGGSQREERLDVLEARIREAGMDVESYWWYLDLRRFGTVPHSGFGLGFERFVQYLTGMQNIRDVIPFPRALRSAEF